MNSKQYEAAYESSGLAIKIYKPILAAYRAGLVSDDEFIAAQNEYYAAMAIYDTAYAPASMEVSK